jgi:GGDEF domain-containing protein
LISIRKSLGDLERVEELRQVICQGYANAIRAMSDYSVELDPEQASELRQNLRRIREQLDGATQPEDYQAVQANLRGELRLYRDRSGEWLERLHRDLQSATMAMQTLAGGVTANGIDHEKRLRADLGSLASADSSQDLSHVKKVIHEAAESIGSSWEQLRRANQLVIAQLNDEIQSLHREIDNERRALFTDAASGAWNREKVRLRIEDNLNRDEAFCAVIASIGNLKRLSASYPRSVIDGALKALVKRIYGIVGKETMIGRWSEDEFAILLELDPAQAMAVSSQISKELSTRYTVQENGVARNVTLRVSTSIIDRPVGGAAGHFRAKLATIDVD